MPEEEGDLVREYKAMHEDKFLSSWLGGDEERREEERGRIEGRGKKGGRRG